MPGRVNHHVQDEHEELPALKLGWAGHYTADDGADAVERAHAVLGV